MTLLRQGGWTRWPTEVPSKPYHSVILWFCEGAWTVHYTFWTRSLLLRISNALFIIIIHSKQVAYSNTASNWQEQENFGTRSALSFTGLNRQEKSQDYWRRKYYRKQSFKKVAKSNLRYYCNAVINRQSLIPLSIIIDLRLGYICGHSLKQWLQTTREEYYSSSLLNMFLYSNAKNSAVWSGAHWNSFSYVNAKFLKTRLSCFPLG